jgi:hypothetical protein
MRITIHQPEHLPYFGLLDKINKSDIFVVLDDVQYVKSNFQNRNKILTKNGVKWLTIPINKNGRFKTILEQETFGDWKVRYKNKVIESYRKYDHFEEGFYLIDSMLSINSNKLLDYNLFYIKQLKESLKIKTEIVLSSSLNVKETSSKRIQEICKCFPTTEYIAGPASKNYLNNIDIKIINHESKFQPYLQKNSSIFIPMLSSLDIIMSVGLNQLSIMLSNSNTI